MYKSAQEIAAESCEALQSVYKTEELQGLVRAGIEVTTVTAVMIYI